MSALAHRGTKHRTSPFLVITAVSGAMLGLGVVLAAGSIAQLADHQVRGAVWLGLVAVVALSLAAFMKRAAAARRSPP